jgi:predicted nucleotidyltransferase
MAKDDMKILIGSWTNMNVIVKMKFGSHLYGTSTPLSDTDYKAV